VQCTPGTRKVDATLKSRWMRARGWRMSQHFHASLSGLLTKVNGTDFRLHEKHVVSACNRTFIYFTIIENYTHAINWHTSCTSRTFVFVKREPRKKPKHSLQTAREQRENEQNERSIQYALCHPCNVIVASDRLYENDIQSLI